MTDSTALLSRQFTLTPITKSLFCYCAKAALTIGALYVLAHLAPNMPPIAVALPWTLISSASAAVIVYRIVMRKTHNQSKFEDGLLSRLNQGRFFSLLIAFVISAICSAGIILETPKWGTAEWIITAAFIPVHAAIFALAKRRASSEYALPYRTASALTWSCLLTGMLLCFAYAAASLIQPPVEYASASEAFIAAEQPFAESPSALIAEAGTLMAFMDGITLYGLSEVANASFPLYLAFRVFIIAPAFFGIASLFGACILERSDLKRILVPLSPKNGPIAYGPIVKRYAVTAAALPLLLTIVFLGADYKSQEIARSSDYTAAENFVRDQIGIAAFLLDGKYYDYQSVENLLSDTERKSSELSEEAKNTLIPLINESYDKRIENVDAYLDWYYSLPADYTRLASMITGTTEEFVSNQFKEKIEQGIDDSAIAEELDTFSARAEQIKREAAEALSAYELSSTPEWLIKPVETLETDFLSEPLQPAQNLLDAHTRIGVSATSGFAAGVLTKAISKPFFNKFVTKIGSALGTRAAGAAAGGTAGSFVGPLGTIAGIAAGTAMGMGVDAALLAIDEMQNRDNHKAEIVEAIEEERERMLSLLE